MFTRRIRESPVFTTDSLKESATFTGCRRSRKATAPGVSWYR
ncbi:hypothetical protein [Streptomyces sp. URMC 125]